MKEHNELTEVTAAPYIASALRRAGQDLRLLSNGREGLDGAKKNVVQGSGIASDIDVGNP